MAKKKNKKELEKIEKTGDFGGDILDKLYIVLGIIIFLSLFYLLTLYITYKNASKNDESKNEPTEAVINYEDIMIGRSLSMGNEDYLVLFYDKEDEDIASDYASLISEYKANAQHVDIYTVNMGSSFNKSYTTTGSANKNPESVSDMKINGPTLIKVSGGKVTEYIEGKEEISNYLK